MKLAANEEKLLSSSYQLICYQFVPNLSGANYKGEEWTITSQGGKQGNWKGIFLLGLGQSSCRLICNVW